MITYQNIGASTKTFYGVTFKPGDIHQVSGFINNKYFIRVKPPVEEKPVETKVETKETKVETKEKKSETKKSDSSKSSNSKSEDKSSEEK